MKEGCGDWRGWEKDGDSLLRWFSSEVLLCLGDGSRSGGSPSWRWAQARGGCHGVYCRWPRWQSHPNERSPFLINAHAAAPRPASTHSRDVCQGSNLAGEKRLDSTWASCCDLHPLLKRKGKAKHLNATSRTPNSHAAVIALLSVRLCIHRQIVFHTLEVPQTG